MAKQILFELTASEEKAVQALRRLEAQERRTGQSMAAGSKQTGGEIAANFAAGLDQIAKHGAVTKSKLIREFKGIGPEGKTIAESLGQHFTNQMGAAGKKSVGDLITELQKIDPAAAKVALDAAAELKRVDDSFTLTQVHDQLRDVGGIAQVQADELTRILIDADDRAGREMNDVVAKINKIDPESKTAGDQLERHIREASTTAGNHVAEASNRLREFGPAGEAAADELERHFDTAESKVKGSIDSMVDRLRTFSPAAASAANELDRRMKTSTDKSRANFKAMSIDAASHIRDIAGAYVGIHEAIELVIELNRKVMETNEAAFESLTDRAGGDRRLLQVSTDADDYQTLRKRADRLSIDHGIGRDEARELVFSARSEKFEGAEDYIASNAQVVDVKAGAKVSGQLPALFGREGLTPQQAMVLTLNTASFSKEDNETIARVLPTAAAGGALAGSSAAEVAALVSVLSSRYKTADTASDRVNAFGAMVAGDKKSGLAGLGVVGALKKLRSMDEADRSKALGGSQELQLFYAIATEELSKVSEQTAANQKAMSLAGTDRSIIAMKRSAANADPRLRSMKRVASEKNRLEVERENRRAITEGDRQAEEYAALADAEIAQESGTQIALAESLGGWERTLGVGDGSTSRNLVIGGDSLPKRLFAGYNDLSNELRTIEMGGVTFDERNEVARVQSGMDKIEAEIRRLDRSRVGVPELFDTANEAGGVVDAIRNPSGLDFFAPTGPQAERHAERIDRIRSLFLGRAAGADDELGTRVADAAERQAKAAEEAATEAKRTADAAERTADAAEASAKANDQTARNTNGRQMFPEMIRTDAGRNPGAQPPSQSTLTGG